MKDTGDLLRDYLKGYERGYEEGASGYRDERARLLAVAEAAKEMAKKWYSLAAYGSPPDFCSFCFANAESDSDGGNQRCTHAPTCPVLVINPIGDKSE